MSMNITGMASGIDVNNIIEELMKIARRPVVRNEALIEVTGEIKELWRETNVRMDALYRSLNGLVTESNFTARQAASSNNDVVGASVTGRPVDGTYNLNVQQLAARHAVAMGTGKSNPNEALGKAGKFFLDTGKTAQSFGLSYEGPGDLVKTEELGNYRYREGNIFKLEADVFKTDAGVDDAIIMGSWSDVESVADWSLFKTGAGEIAFQYKDSDGDMHVWQTVGSGYLQDNQWHKVSVEYAFGEPGSMNLSVDGQQITGDWMVRDGNKPPSDSGGPMYIGSRDGVVDTEWQGKIGEVTLYKNNVQTGKWPETDAAYTIKLNDLVSNNWLTGTLSAGYHAELTPGQGPYTLDVDVGISTSDKVHIYIDSFTSPDGSNLMDELKQYYTDKMMPLPNDVYNGDDPFITITHNGVVWQALDFEGNLFTIEDDHILGSFTFSQKISDSDDRVYAEHEFNFRISQDADPRMVEVKAGDSLNDIADKINALDGDVAASVVKVGNNDYRLVLTSKTDGTVGKIHAWDGEGVDEILQYLNIISSGGGVATEFVYETQEAADPVFTMNGIAIQRNTNTIDDLIEGVTFELKGLGTSTVQVSQSTEQAQVAVAEFVEVYNEALAWISALMDKDDGPLKGDATLIRIQRQLRSIISNPLSIPQQQRYIDSNPLGDIEGFSALTYNSLSAIGIMSFDEKGYLEVNSIKLRDSLLNDADGVYQLFSREVSLTDGFRSGPEGIARQLQEFTQRITARSRGVIAERLNYLDRRIDYLEMNNERLERRLESEEKRLLRQFTFMETYISTMMGQSGFLDAFQAARADMSDR